MLRCVLRCFENFPRAFDALCNSACKDGQWPVVGEVEWSGGQVLVASVVLFGQSIERNDTVIDLVSFCLRRPPGAVGSQSTESNEIVIDLLSFRLASRFRPQRLGKPQTPTFRGQINGALRNTQHRPILARTCEARARRSQRCTTRKIWSGFAYITTPTISRW